MPWLLAHAGEALRPHDVWRAWNGDPFVFVTLCLLGVLYALGRRKGVDTPARGFAFWGAFAALFLALISPIDAMSHTLVSAHMVQHVLLILVAAPLLAISAPGGALLRGTPPAVVHTTRLVRKAVRLTPTRLQRLRSPMARWLLYVVTLWVWHASVVYGAAIENEPVHLLEHAMFLGTAFLVWSAILGPPRVRVSRGLGMLAVFTLGLQSIFLSVLLTFSKEPWYVEYLSPPPAWGLDPLTDQQLAGVLMWVPAGFVHTGIVLWLFVRWIRESDEPELAAPSSRSAQLPAATKPLRTTR